MILQSRLCETVERDGASVHLSVRPSVRLSRHLTVTAACGGFAAERRAGGSYRSTGCDSGGRRAPSSNGAAARAAARRSAANASSVTLKADVGS